jgi:stress response protein YsnF
LSYLNKDAGWLHLDRDDQGNITDTVIIEGREVVYPVNQEVVTIRGIIGGEYTLNLYYYENRSNQPVTVTVKIEKVNPSLELVYYDEVVLEREDVEKTVLRFTLNGNGEFLGINHNPKSLTNYNLEVRS